MFAETGYAVSGRQVALARVRPWPASPPNLPAHAHGDALSFQLWVDGKPVVVDPGMPTYGAGHH